MRTWCAGGRGAGDKDNIKPGSTRHWSGGLKASRVEREQREGRGPGLLLTVTSLRAPHAPAAARLQGESLWAPCGGQRSAPRSTAPTSLGSTKAEGS